MSFKGAAIVTGSAQGIGRAISRRLAAENYRVCVNDVPRNAAKVDALVMDIREQHGADSAIGILADVTKPKQVRDMIDRTVRELKSDLTLMVANAGVCQVKKAVDLTLDDVNFVFDINFNGLFNCYTLAAKQMIAQQQQSGLKDAPEASKAWKHRIIGASSIVAFRGYALSSHYTATKWAVRGFTQAFAQEMAQHKIAVNAYAPGVTATDMWDGIDQGLQSVAGTSEGQASEEGAQNALMGRLANPEDIANVVAGFLAGPDASFINGQTLVIDGGIVLT